MGYDLNDERNGLQRPRSRRRGQSAGREVTLAPRSRSAQEIPPPGSWDMPGNPAASGWHSSEQYGEKTSLELDTSLKNGGRKRMSKKKRRIITMIIAE